MFGFFKRMYNRVFTDNIYRRIRQFLFTIKWFKTDGLENPQPAFDKEQKKLGFFLESPPPFIKHKIVKAYAEKFHIYTLIETGTFYGSMVIATRKKFKKIYSIEIDEKLHRIAKHNCSKYNHIFLYQGDSVEILPNILLEINKPCLFWLDAHYSGEGTGRGRIDTPIIQELKFILNNSNFNHVILIDDARCFIGENGYPTVKEVKDLIFRYNSDWVFLVKDDIIRIYKKKKYSN